MFSAIKTSTLIKRVVLNAGKSSTKAGFSNGNILKFNYSSDESSYQRFNGNENGNNGGSSFGSRNASRPMKYNNNANFNDKSQGNNPIPHKFDIASYLERLSSMSVADAQKLLFYYLKAELKGKASVQHAFIRLIEKELPEVLGSGHYNVVLRESARILGKGVAVSILLDSAEDPWRIEKLRSENSESLSNVERNVLRIVKAMHESGVRLDNSVHFYLLARLAVLNEASAEISAVFEELENKFEATPETETPKEDRLFSLVKDSLDNVRISYNNRESELAALSRFTAVSAAKFPNFRDTILLKSSLIFESNQDFASFYKLYQEIGPSETESYHLVRRISVQLAQTGKKDEALAKIATIADPEHKAAVERQVLDHIVVQDFSSNESEEVLKASLKQRHEFSDDVSSLLMLFLIKNQSSEAVAKQALEAFAEAKAIGSIEVLRKVMATNSEKAHAEYLKLLAANVEKSEIDPKLARFVELYCAPEINIIDGPENRHVRQFKLTRNTFSEAIHYVNNYNSFLLTAILKGIISNFDSCIGKSNLKREKTSWFESILKSAESLGLTTEAKGNLISASRGNANIRSKIGELTVINTPEPERNPIKMDLEKLNSIFLECRRRPSE